MGDPDLMPPPEVAPHAVLWSAGLEMRKRNLTKSGH